jgi:hypothetical protein
MSALRAKKEFTAPGFSLLLFLRLIYTIAVFYRHIFFFILNNLWNDPIFCCKFFTMVLSMDITDNHLFLEEIHQFVLKIF